MFRFYRNETSGNNHGNIVFVSFEQTDIRQFSNITFNFNRVSILTIDSLKAMGRFRNQLILADNTWNTRYNTPKDYRYSSSSTDWTLISWNFTVENYGPNLVCDQLDTTHGDMCFRNITITHSV